MISNLNIDWQSFLFDILFTVAGAAAILLIGRWLAGFVKRFLHDFLLRAKLTPSLREILERSAYYGILLFSICWALIVFGVPAELLGILLLGILVAAALALRESLGDLAATVLFIIFQPFKTGDYIETNGTAGRVQEMLLLHTVLRMSDNRKLVIPNGNIQNSNIINYSVEDSLQVDAPVMVSYADNLAVIKDTLLEIAAAEVRVLRDPSPQVAVAELGESGVRVVLSVSVKADDYWAVRPALNEQIKFEFDRRNITFAVPQLQLLGEENANRDTRTRQA